MMGKQRMRMFSMNLTGKREFYVTEHYRLIDDATGMAEMTGKTHDITNDIVPYLAKAQRDMAAMVYADLIENADEALEFESVERWLQFRREQVA